MKRKCHGPSNPGVRFELSRRRFLGYLGLAGLSVTPLGSCASNQGLRESKSSTTEEESWTPFLQIEASGTPFEIGKTVGSASRDLITGCLDERSEWFEDLKKFASADRVTRIDGFRKAIEFHHPEILSEMKGLAEGAGIPFEDILIYNLNPELGALKRQIEGDACSTFHLVSEKRTILIHNEDGHEANHRRMAILKARPTDAPGFTCLVYPGLVPGSVPFINDAGLLMSTNFIGAKEVKVGVPRYVLGRAVIYQRSIDDAIKVATNRDRAYSFHLNLGSLGEKRLVALDVDVSGFASRETRGLFLQTNHFVLPDTKGIEQTAYRPGGSSDSRYQVLSKGVETLPGLKEIEEKHLLELLSSHEATMQPYSPCRHPTDDSQSRTLATAVFDLNKGSFHLYEGNPCKKRLQILNTNFS